MQLNACVGCGHEFPAAVAGRHRIVRCYFCPPQTDLCSDAENLRITVLNLELKYRTVFEVLDRMESWAGSPNDRHVCRLPAKAGESIFDKGWMCVCGQAWEKPAWHTAWQPIGVERFGELVWNHSDTGDECDCEPCRKKRA